MIMATFRIIPVLTAPAISALVLLASLMASAVPQGAQSQGPGTVRMPGHVLPALSSARIDAKQQSSATLPLPLTVVLRRSDPTGFEDYLREVYDPHSPEYLQFLDPHEVSDRFGPSQRDYASVRAHFEDQGFAVTDESSNRMTIVVEGTRALVEQSLGLSIDEYQLGDQVFFANSVGPALPAAIAEKVLSIKGLSNLARPQRQSASAHEINGVFHNGSALKKAFCEVVITIYNAWEQPGNWWAGTENWFNSGWNAWWKAYNDAVGGEFTPIPEKPTKWWSCDSNGDAVLHSSNGGTGAGGKALADRENSDDPSRGPVANWLTVDGSGQKIGLVEFDTFNVSDIADYLALLDKEALLGNLSQVHVGGGATLGPDESEVLLDINFILPFVSGAQVTVYDAPFSGAGSFQALFNRMIVDGMTIISNSWSYCENETTLADVQSIDAILQTAAASGISVFNASGDTGSTCLNGSPNTIGVPASSPNATAVGGTSSVPGPGSLYGSETWWDGSATIPPTGQGGFGLSRFFPRPAYQDGFHGAPMRSIPDVSTNADPFYGIQICQASAGGCPTSAIWGGTSMGAPAWAAYTAMLNQAQGTNLGLLNPLLYPLAGTDAFHSPAGMGSDFAHVGLGSPNVNRLHVALANKTLGPSFADYSGIVPSIRVEDVDTVAQLRGIPADGVTPFYVVAVLRDAGGNILSGKTVSLSASPSANVVITPPTGVTTVANGAVLFTVTNTAVEDVTFTAFDLTDGVVMNTPNPVSFVAPPAASGGLAPATQDVPADGVSTALITVTLRDALDRPSPGKVVTLAQGDGHSIIAGPASGRTDANGQIQFTATNNVAETVTYTAVDVSDGGLPVPGSASVNFTPSSGTSCVGPAPTGAPGYTVTPFATGFVARNFSFGNVNWGGCPGASNPAFDNADGVYIADFPDGDFFLIGRAGGAVTNANVLANHGPTLNQPAFGKDGKLYALRGATTGNFTTGDIIELDPATGALVRVVVGGLTCPNGLSVDPLSGDLLFDDQCFGAGADDPSLWRVRNPGSTDPADPPTLTVYATLPATPNGAISIAPDGTIYVVSGYTDPNATVLEISGTDQPQPPTITPLTGVTSSYWVTVGETLANGAAKSLIVLSDDRLKLVDITVPPPTSTDLTNEPSGSGVVGPDGCLYFSQSDAIYRLTPNAGECGFAVTDPLPMLSLSPTKVTPSPAQGGTQTFTANLSNVADPDGTPVFFQIDGANAHTKMGRADASGAASITYEGIFSGDDTVTARTSVADATLYSNTVQVSWGPGPHVSFTSLNTGPLGAVAGVPVALAAALSDVSVDPAVAIAGATVELAVDGQSCNGVTDAGGIASCELTFTVEGAYTLTASFAGTAQHLPSSAARRFNVLPPGETITACHTGTVTGGGTATACLQSTEPACAFDTAMFVPLSSVAEAPPSGTTIPFGLFQFTAPNCADPVTLSITYPQVLPVDAGYWIYGPTPGQGPNWHVVPASVNGNVLITVLSGPDIGAPGGAGFAVAVGVESIPALDGKSLALLIFLISLAAVTALRLRRHARGV